MYGEEAGQLAFGLTAISCVQCSMSMLFVQCNMRHDGMGAADPKSYRKALDALREQGPDNVAVILQGRMVTPGAIVDAGISAMPKKA